MVKKGRKPDGTIQYWYVYASKYSEAKKKEKLHFLRYYIPRILYGILPVPIAYQKIYLPIYNSFDQLIEEWENLAAHRVRESSYQYYDTIIEQHIRPFCGSCKISALNKEEILLYQQYLTDKNLSTSYIHTIFIVWNSLLELAKEQQYLSEYPIVSHLPDKSSKEIHPFTMDEWEKLTNYLLHQNTNFSFGLLLGMYIGLRVGEICGLTWNDFDDNGNITIHRTVYRTKNKYHIDDPMQPKTILKIGSPKTSSFCRTIPIPHFLLSYIPQYRLSSDYYILTGTTVCMEPISVQRAFQKILSNCHIP